MWSKKTLNDIMTSCIIMHNMIVESRRGQPLDLADEGESSSVPLGLSHFDDDSIIEVLERSSGSVLNEKYLEVRDKDKHFKLRSDLVEHLWDIRGNK